MYTSFDVIILLIILITSAIGLYKGIVYIAIKLISFLSVIFTTTYVYPYIRLFITEYIVHYFFTSLISAAISYILSLILFTFLSSKTILLLEGIRYGLADRLLGCIVGIIKGFLISLLLFISIVIFNTSKYESVNSSRITRFDFEIENYPTYLQNSTTARFLDTTMQNITRYAKQDLLQLLLLFNKTNTLNLYS